MATKLTPPLLAKGRYELKMPFQVDPGKIYTCMAIRSFDDIYELGEDVYETYYQPHNLSQEVFERDKELQTNIITLMSEDGPVVYVPDTYIVSYPAMGDVAYSHVVLSISLGAIPDYLSLDFLKDQLANVASDTIGITPEVKVHVAPHAGVVTPEEHEIAEVNRLAAIKNRTTDYAKLKELQNQNAALQERIATLEQIIIDHGLLE